MNLPHLHLVINHLPIFGTMIGSLVLLHGLWSNSRSTLIAAYNVFLLSAIGAVIAYFTGEPAEELVENIPGVAEAAISAHEEAAEIAFICISALGLLAGLAAINTWFSDKSSKSLRYAVLVCAVLSFGLMGRTGYLGGKIRHTELNEERGKPANSVIEEYERD